MGFIIDFKNWQEVVGNQFIARKKEKGFVINSEKFGDIVLVNAKTYSNRCLVCGDKKGGIWEVMFKPYTSADLIGSSLVIHDANLLSVFNAEDIVNYIYRLGHTECSTMFSALYHHNFFTPTYLVRDMVAIYGGSIEELLGELIKGHDSLESKEEFFLALKTFCNNSSIDDSGFVDGQNRVFMRYGINGYTGGVSVIKTEHSHFDDYSIFKNGSEIIWEIYRKPLRLEELESWWSLKNLVH